MEVRTMWDEWDIQESEEFQNDDTLKFDAFYNEKTDPRHNYKNGCRQMDIEQIW